MKKYKLYMDKSTNERVITHKDFVVYKKLEGGIYIKESGNSFLAGDLAADKGYTYMTTIDEYDLFAEIL